MGYYNYQQGLIYRHLNQDEGWIGHEKNCRQFILRAIDFHRPEKVTVFGSGWLLEVPLAEMAERVRTIVLTDIVHPPEVVSQTSGMKNVRLSFEDVTGGLIEEVWNKAGRRTFLNKLHSLDSILIPEYHPVEDPGLVISVNILTQLESLPEKLLRKKASVSEKEFLNFRKEIQLKHLHFIEKYKGILISDKAEILTDKGGNTTETETALVKLPEGNIKEEWVWNFDLLRTDYVQKESVFKVVAIMF